MMNSTLGAPSPARSGSGQAGDDTSNVRPITPGKAVPGLYSLSPIGVYSLPDCLQFRPQHDEWKARQGMPGTASLRDLRAQQSLNGSMRAAAGTILELIEHTVQVERRRLLPGWELLERLDLLLHIRLCRHQQESVVEYPVPVGVRVLVRAFEGIAAKIEYLGNTKRHERLRPQCHGFGPL